MKKLIPFSLILTLSLFAFGETTSRTMNSEVGSDAEMLEAEEDDDSLDEEEDNEERMEERERNNDFYKQENEIDYEDRTRTNRERKALNTGSHASDDQ